MTGADDYTYFTPGHCELCNIDQLRYFVGHSTGTNRLLWRQKLHAAIAEWCGPGHDYGGGHCRGCDYDEDGHLL